MYFVIMKSENIELMPRRMTKNSCGYDFYAPETIKMEPGKWYTLDTGVCFDGTEHPRFDGALISDWFMMIVPRSSYGMKYGLKIRNTAGIIDKDYRDTIKASVSVDVPFTLEKGQRFMQGIVIPFGKINGELEPVNSRVGGIGSTDKGKTIKPIESYQ